MNAYRMLLCQAIAPALFAIGSGSIYAGSFADRVVSFTAGPGAGFGQANMPGNVLGAPHGNSNPNTPTFDEQHLVSLGDGGTITLEFVSTRIVDGPGVDLTVFENPVIPNGQPDQSYVDAAIVAVSTDGTSWTTFPFNFIPPAPDNSLLDKQNYVGFAGVQQSLSSSTNGISPFDTANSGGDQFDLAQIGVTNIRFVRITDTGTTGPTQTMDADNDIVDDPGNHLLFAPSIGFDLDAVVGINTLPAPSAATREWMLYE